jgi:hypothetical protein
MNDTGVSFLILLRHVQLGWFIWLLEAAEAVRMPTEDDGGLRGVTCFRAEEVNLRRGTFFSSVDVLMMSFRG